MERIVETRSLAIERAGVRILHGVDLSVRSGEIVGISGPNGSGKTTLLRAIATLTSLSEGELELFGAPARPESRRRIGLIGHRPFLLPQLTLAENLHHIARLRDISPERVDKALDVVGLDAARDRRASASSFGMLRRVEIAQQLIDRPGLLMLDEAYSGLDETAHKLLAELVRLTSERGGAVIMVSHDREHLEKECSTLHYLSSGKLGASR